MTIYGITDSKYTKSKDIYWIEPRTLKKLVQGFNSNYGKTEENSWYIVSSRYGYKLTQDFTEIEEDLERRERNAKLMLSRLSPQRKGLDWFRKNKSMGGMC